MSQEEKKQTAPETEAAAEKPETSAQEAPEKEDPPDPRKRTKGKHDCKHHHHETAALQAKLEAEEKKNAEPQEPAAPHRCRV